MTSSELPKDSRLAGADLQSELNKPKRITITVNYSLYRKLVERSEREARSISNLASYLIQRDLEGGS